jgi:hypothetical protein
MSKPIAAFVLVLAGSLGIAPHGSSETPPSVVERPDITGLWEIGTKLRMKITSDDFHGAYQGTETLIAFVPNCRRSPCTKWKAEYPQRRGIKEEYRYRDGDTNVYDETFLDGRHIEGTRYQLPILHFPLTVPSTANGGGTFLSMGGGEGRIQRTLEYSWSTVASAYSGPITALRIRAIDVVACTGGCGNGGGTITSEYYYYPERGVCVHEFRAGVHYELLSVEAPAPETSPPAASTDKPTAQP